MQPKVFRYGVPVLAVVLAGVLSAGSALAATPVSRQLLQDPAAPYRVFITEVAQTFVKDQPFTGHFATTVTMPNGVRRSVKLVPTLHDGGLVVEFDDTVDGASVGSNGGSFMGPNGTMHNGSPAVGEIMVVLRDVDHPDTGWHMAMRPGARPRLVWSGGGKVDPSTTRFEVSIYRVEKTIAFGAPLIHQYSAALAAADGSSRTIVLTPEQRGGKTVVRFDNGGQVSVLPLGDRVVAGNLVVSVADMRPLRAAFQGGCARGTSAQCKR